jgi:hypothetical protein
MKFDMAASQLMRRGALHMPQSNPIRSLARMRMQPNTKKVGAAAIDIFSS